MVPRLPRTRDGGMSFVPGAAAMLFSSLTWFTENQRTPRGEELRFDDCHY